MTTVIFSDGKKYTFVPDAITNPSDFVVDSTTTVINDVYEQSIATATVRGKLIVCNDIAKLKRKVNIVRKETYEEYLKDMQTNGDKYAARDTWIYNVLDGISEQDSIIRRTDKCIVIPNYTWKQDDMQKLQVLVIPFDRSIRTLRDLTSEHIDLLLHMKHEALNAIEEKYGIDRNKIKMFFHYAPSTYHMHIHFINIDFETVFSSVEHCHELDSVLFNLSIDGDYYRKIKLNRK